MPDRSPSSLAVMWVELTRRQLPNYTNATALLPAAQWEGAGPVAWKSRVSWALAVDVSTIARLMHTGMPTASAALAKLSNQLRQGTGEGMRGVGSGRHIPHGARGGAEAGDRYAEQCAGLPCLPNSPL